MKKIIDRNGRLFGFISVIDLLVIVVVAVMGFALYTKNTQMAITSTNTADQTITYQILASGIRTYVAEAVREGDQLFDPDRSSGGTLGTITDIQLMPGTKLAEFDDGHRGGRHGGGWRGHADHRRGHRPGERVGALYPESGV